MLPHFLCFTFISPDTTRQEKFLKMDTVGEKVRREKALDFSGCKSRPGTGSLHPVAIEAAAKATKLSELSMERVAWRLRERAGHNGSERCAGPETIIAGADLTFSQGRR